MPHNFANFVPATLPHPLCPLVTLSLQICFINFVLRIVSIQLWLYRHCSFNLAKNITPSIMALRFCPITLPHNSVPATLLIALCLIATLSLHVCPFNFASSNLSLESCPFNCCFIDIVPFGP